MAELLAARDAATAATWSSCAWTASPISDVAGALDGRRRPGHRDLPPDVGRRPVRRQRGDARRDPRRRRSTLGAEYVDVEWRGRLHRSHRARRRRDAGDRARRTTSPACRRPRRARARDMRGAGAGADQGGRHAAPADATRCRCSTIARDGDAVVDRHGRCGRADRGCWPRGFGSRWTYAGHGVAPGQIPAARMVERVPVSQRRARTRALRRGRRQRDAFAVAGDAQRRVRGGGHRRRVRAAAGGGLRRLPDVRRGARGRGRQRDDSVQARRAARGARVADDLDARRWARRTRCGGTWATADGKRPTPTSPGSSTPLEAVYPGGRCTARARPSSAPAARRGRSSSRCCRAARASRCTRGAASRRRKWPASLGATAGAWPPPAGLVGPAGQLHAARRRGARDESPLPGGPFDGRLVYDLTYGAGESRAAARGARGGLPRRSTACRC